MPTLPVEPLRAAAFAPFGDVIETTGAHRYPINNGTTERFHDLALLDVLEAAGRPLVNIFRTRPAAPPIRLRLMERHPLASQAFVPLDGADFLVVVAPPSQAFEPAGMRAFRATGGQGVNYARGVWHHPVLALDRVTDFLVIDRGGGGHNLDEAALNDEPWILDLDR